MAGKFTLTILGGSLDGTEYEFDKPAQCIIGRAEDCTIRLPNTGWEFRMVSRHHCRLDVDPPHVHVHDLGSRNGTYINGRLIGLRDRGEAFELVQDKELSPNHLEAGDILGIGPIHFLVRLEGVDKVKGERAGAGIELGECIKPPTTNEMMYSI